MNLEVSHHEPLAHIQLAQIHVDVGRDYICWAKELNGPLDYVEISTWQVQECKYAQNRTANKLQ